MSNQERIITRSYNWIFLVTLFTSNYLVHALPTEPTPRSENEIFQGLQIKFQTEKPEVEPFQFETVETEKAETEKAIHGIIFPEASNESAINLFVEAATLTNFSIKLSVTETNNLNTTKMKKNSTHTASIIMTVLICSLPPIFIPINLKTVWLFVAISQKKQPMFFLFGAVHTICALDLVVALVEGTALWIEISKIGCEILGAFQVIIFFSLSLVMSTICIFRITAVIKPTRYKHFADKRVVLRIIAGFSIFSILISSILILTNTLNFDYLGPPHSIGCSLFLGKETFQMYLPLLTAVVFFVNFILTTTFFVVQRYFKKPTKSSSEEVNRMKRGALRVTSVATITHFICHAPEVIIYILTCVDSGLVLGLGYPYLLILDFILIFCPHIYSCVLPLFLVTSKTLEQIGTAAQSSRRIEMRQIGTLKSLGVRPEELGQIR